jgi:peptide/nickel transport system substrate-binding protein
MGSGYVVSKKAAEELGEAFSTQGVGTGPYQLEEWAEGDRYVLAKFEDYTGQNYDYAEPVEWDTIEFILMPDDNATAIALETGEIDFGRISTADVDYLDALDDVDAQGYDTLGYRWVGMNVQHPKLQDVNVRKAIRYAIDVPSILEAVWDGRFRRACAIVAPGQLGHWADAPCYERDLDQARELLAAAGAEGLQLEYHTGDDQDGRIIGEIIQANLAEVGIDVEVVIMDGAALEDLMIGETGPEFIQLYESYYTTSPDPSWSFVWFTCEQVTIWNTLEWCDEEFDRLHYAALQETDQETRAEMYIQMQQIWDEAANTVWLAHPTLFFGYATNLQPSLMPHAAIIAWDFRSQ